MSADDSQSAQYIRMTETPIPKLIGRLSVPTVLTMLVSNFYNLADTAFVGTLGNSASGAVGIVFGYMAVLQAVGFLFGQGCGSNISRALGQKNNRLASQYAFTGFALSFASGLAVSVLSFVFLKEIAFFLGSTDTIYPYARTYLIFIIISAPFTTAGFTLNNILRFEGKAARGMIGMMTGALLNIAGDAVFIFVFRMGITGAGLSTALSQTASFVILLYQFVSGKSQTSLSPSHFTSDLSVLTDILGTGLPSLIRQSLGSLCTIVLNNQASVYGDEAIAAMSIVSRTGFFVMSLAIGIGQGYQPVCGYNYGAGKYSRVKKGFWFTTLAAWTVVILLGTLAVVFSDSFIRLFRDDEAVIAIAERALKLHFEALMFMPLCMITEMGLQSTGQKLLASFSAMLKNGMVFIPVLLVLSHFRGLSGIQEAQPLTYLIDSVVCIPFTFIFLRKLSLFSSESDIK